jgi:lytic murein transglycosylase
VESNFGQEMGKRPLVQSLTTLSCMGDRANYFRSELMATLKIIDHGDVPAEKLNGSWAGAFGQTQFMPSTFLRLAVDFEGDGRRDIVDSAPDALASTANYLAKSGWRRGVAWGFEVKLPNGYSGPSGRKIKQSMSFWAARGLIRIDGRPLGDGEAGLLIPAGRQGPAFLVTRNFDVVYSYNAAESYTLAACVLADRLGGGRGIVTPWPTDDPLLSREGRKELQALLQRRGYDIGGDPDGHVGTKSKAAIADFQQKAGLEVNGRASVKVLAALKR